MKKLYRILAGLVLSGLLFTPLRHSSAHEPAVPGPNTPGFVDGFWSIVMASSGPVNIDEQEATVTISGVGYITVREGEISGDYSMFGDNIVFGPDSSATGTMASAGRWTGTDTSLRMVDGDTHLSGIVQVEGMIQEVTFDIPSTGAETEVPLLSATCTTVVGDFTSVVNRSFAGTGASPGLTGVLIASRLLDQAPDDPSLADSYRMQAADLLLEGMLFAATAEGTGTVDPVAFNDLMARAEALYNALERAQECGFAEADAWIGLLAGMVWELLRTAVTNPHLFDHMSLGRLVLAAVRMGVLSDLSATSDWSELEALLAVELTRQAAQADADEDCDAALSIFITASILGQPGLVTPFLPTSCGG